MTAISSQTVSDFYQKLSKPEAPITPKIDLSSYRYITNSGIVELCSLLEYCIITYEKKIRVIMPTFHNAVYNNLEKLKYLLNYDNENLKIKLKGPEFLMNDAIILDNIRIFNFHCYLYNKGFCNFWDDPYTDGQIILENFSFEYAESIFLRYKFDPKNKSTEINLRNTFVHRISGTPKDRKKILFTSLRDLERRLPQKHKDSPLFKDGEFESIFLNELADNIASHSNTRGYFSARSLSADDMKGKSKNNIDLIFNDLPTEFKGKTINNGFFEVCISDSGPGIAETLGKAYKKVLTTFFDFDNENLKFNDQNVIEFAFDELGTRFIHNNQNALTQIHSLNRILQYTRKYGGCLQVLCNSLKLSFNTFNQLKRGKWGLGFKAEVVEKTFHKGLTINVLLPHYYLGTTSYPKAWNCPWPEEYPLEKQFPEYYYVGIELGQKPTKTEILKRTSQVVRELNARRIGYLCFDFSGTEEWDIHSLIDFLRKTQTNVSRNQVWGINLSAKHIDELKSLNLKSEGLNFPDNFGFLCLDNTINQKPHFISKTILNISDSFLFTLSNVEKADEAITFDIDDLISNIKNNSGIIYNKVDLSNLLSNHTALFSSLGGDSWRCDFDRLRMTRSAENSMKFNFKKILEKTSSIYGEKTDKTPDGKIAVYEQPSTGVYTNEFIWTYKLLQIGKYTEELSIRFKYILDQYIKTTYPEKSTGSNDYIYSIVCVTAPARILGEAISKLYNNQPPVIDLRTINDLKKDESIEDFSVSNEISVNKPICLIVTDVLSSGTLLSNLIEVVKKANYEDIIIAALIKFINKKGNIEGWKEKIEKTSFKIKDHEQHSKTDTLPVAILYEHPRPVIVEINNQNTNLYQKHWIEPYSLKPYDVEVLVNQFYSWEYKEKIRKIPHRIGVLDAKGCIAYGHFKDHNHHNRILIHMQKAIEDKEIFTMILEDFYEFIKGDPPLFIIIPLHSNISRLISDLKIYLRNRHLNIPVICSIPSDLQGRGQHYLLPEEAKYLLKSVKNPNILFLDDGILSGRTAETIIRALIRYTHDKKIRINELYIYCIVSRLGRFASTKWRNTITMKEDISFSFQEFISFETPVFTQNDCPICKDRERFLSYKDKLFPQSVISHSIKANEELRPTLMGSYKYRDTTPDFFISELETNKGHDFTIIDSPKKNSFQDPLLKKYYEKSKLSLSSVEGCLWWFWEKNYRGMPSAFLLNKFYEWHNDIDDFPLESEELLLSEIISWCIENYESLKSKSAYKGTFIGDDPMPDLFFKLFDRFLQLESSKIPFVLEKIAYSFTKTGRVRGDVRDDLMSIFESSLLSIEKQEKHKIVRGTVVGLYYIIIRLKNINVFDDFSNEITEILKERKKTAKKWHGYIMNLILFLESSQQENEYFFSLYLLLTEKNKVRHKKLFTEDLSKIDYLDSDFPNQIAHLYDTIPIYLRALSKVLDPKFESDPVKKEIEDAIQFGNKIIELLHDDTVNTEPKKVYDTIADFEDCLMSNDKPICKRLEFFNPCIGEIIDLLMKRLSDRRIKGKIVAPNLTNTGTKFHVICDKTQLVDIIKNLSYDVLRDRAKVDSDSVYIDAKIEYGTAHIFIHNNWINHEDAKNYIQKGNSITSHRNFLKPFDGIIDSPVESEKHDFLSMVKISLKSYERA